MIWDPALLTKIWVAAAACLPALCAMAPAVSEGRCGRNLIAWSAAPALGAALFLHDGSSAVYPWVFLHARIGLDPTGRVFLLFTSALWLLSGIYATSYLRSDPRQGRFFFFYGLAMSGNLGLILAQDMISFFVLFALMSFASYGLVVHTGEPEARRAGRVYIILVVIGEVLLFSGLILLAGAGEHYDLLHLAPGGVSPAARLLLITGFGIKAGALPLHVWLPLAHSAAPTPASAVLSGSMINAGLLGWIRFLPPGSGLEMEPAWGAALIAAGLAAAFYGVLLGITQSKPKTILAYSSISQMGLITSAFGLSLFEPAASVPAYQSVLLYAMHHGFAKGALFLGVGIMPTACGPWKSRLAWGGLALAALSLAGAPFTSGSFAKAWVKIAAAAMSQPASIVLPILLSIAAVGSTLLMGRFFQVLARSAQAPDHAAGKAMWIPWMGLLAPTLLIPTLYPTAAPVATFTIAAVWPVAVGMALLLLAWAALRRGGSVKMPHLPPGDLLEVYSAIFIGLRRAWGHVWVTEGAECHFRGTLEKAFLKAFAAGHALEAILGNWQVSGLLFLFLMFVFYLSSF